MSSLLGGKGTWVEADKLAEKKKAPLKKACSRFLFHATELTNVKQSKRIRRVLEKISPIHHRCQVRTVLGHHRYIPGVMLLSSLGA